MPDEKDQCIDSYAEILDTRMCLYRLSKNVRGRIQIEGEPIMEHCAQLNCETEKLKQTINLETVPSGSCESRQGRNLNGKIDIAPFSQAFMQPDMPPHAPPSALERGIHAGEFTWTNGNFKITGTVSGTTGADTLWQPRQDPDARDQRECQVPGLLLGRICGTFDADDVFPKGTQVFGTYRLYIPAPLDPDTDIFGTIEGVILLRC